MIKLFHHSMDFLWNDGLQMIYRGIQRQLE